MGQLKLRVPEVTTYGMVPEVLHTNMGEDICRIMLLFIPRLALGQSNRVAAEMIA